MTTAISVDNVWKRYRKGQTGYHTLREDLYNLTGRLLDFGGEKRRDRDTEHIWALRDVSFEVKPGERVGIIGRNGSGKTTLLRMLAGITRPNQGAIKVRGRLGVLIEIMAGFHPELTGRENVYLNGAIMGMSKKEIKRKFDEIVAFAELEEFIDTPIKRYSSGMHVRLGFAVAAHLDPDVLLIDEVLAVGDAQFQQKCLGKMDTAAQEGRTVVFVSHNMEAVRRLCPRILLFRDGSIQVDGNSDEVISTYLKGGHEEISGMRVYPEDIAPGDDTVRLKSVCLKNHEGDISKVFRIDEDLIVEFKFAVEKPVSDFHLNVQVFAEDRILAFVSADWDSEAQTAATSSYLPGTYLAHLVIPRHLLNSGSYSLTVVGRIPNRKYVFEEHNVLAWEIREVGGAGGITSASRRGIFRPRLNWRVLPANTIEHETT